MAAKKTAAKKTARKKSTAKPAVAKTQTRINVSAMALPRRSLKRAIEVARVLHGSFGGKSATADQLGAVLDISASSSNLPYLLRAATAYGLVTMTDGDVVTLAETGRKIVAKTYTGEDIEGIRKAVVTPTILSSFFTEYDRHPLPETTIFDNVLEAKFSVPRERVAEARELIIENGQFAGIISTIDDKLVVNLGAAASASQIDRPSLVTADSPFKATDPARVPLDLDEASSLNKAEWDKICFYITPIGDEHSEERKHSDFMLKHILRPVAESDEFGMKVVRADGIERQGRITKQILEYLVMSRLCIVDLSFGNPNVFYELGVRHTCKLSAVQIIREGDKIPFDVSQGRTIKIDVSDPLLMIDRADSAKRELAEHMRALAKRESDENPISTWMPNLKMTLESG